MVSSERRSYVRAGFPFKITYRILRREEYETIRSTANRFPSSNKKKLIVDGIHADKTDNGVSLDPGLVDFLLRMDDKLDRIMDILSKDMADEGLLNQGTGVNISGSGMNLIVDRLAESGQIIHSTFTLSRFPLIVMDVFGEVIRVTPVETEGNTAYQLGIKFLDLDPNDRENIIACVFQRQRETIRKSKA